MEKQRQFASSFLTSKQHFKSQKLVIIFKDPEIDKIDNLFVTLDNVKEAIGFEIFDNLPGNYVEILPADAKKDACANSAYARINTVWYAFKINLSSILIAIKFRRFLGFGQLLWRSNSGLHPPKEAFRVASAIKLFPQ